MCTDRLPVPRPGSPVRRHGPRRLCERCRPPGSCSTEAAAVLGYDLLDVCVQRPGRTLNATVVSQPAIFVASLAALESLKAKRPGGSKRVASHGRSEPGRIHRPGLCRGRAFADGLRVVQQRGEAMQAAADATPSGMVSILGLEHAGGRGAVSAGRCSEGLLRDRQSSLPGQHRGVRRPGRLRRGRTPGRRGQGRAPIGWPSPGRFTPPS